MGFSLPIIHPVPSPRPCVCQVLAIALGSYWARAWYTGSVSNDPHGAEIKAQIVPILKTKPELITGAEIPSGRACCGLWLCQILGPGRGMCPSHVRFLGFLSAEMKTRRCLVLDNTDQDMLQPWL